MRPAWHSRYERRLGWLWPLALAGSLVTVAGLETSAADPPYYQRGETWHSTLLSSLEALEESGLETAFEPYESPIVRGGEPARRVRVDVRGARELYLLVTGDPDKVWGVANWAGAQWVDVDGNEHRARRADGWKVLEGRSAIDMNLHSGLYETMRIAGRSFDRGLHVQADSVVRVRLDGRATRFEAWIGIDDWSGGDGNVRFAVVDARTAARRRLWNLVERDFPLGRPRREMRRERDDRVLRAAWKTGDYGALAARYAEACHRVPPLRAEARRRVASVRDAAGLDAVRALYLRSRELAAAAMRVRVSDVAALRRAIDDLRASFEDRYPHGPTFARRLDALDRQRPERLARLGAQDATLDDFDRVATLARDLDALRREALLANPLLDFDRLLLVRRRPVGEPRRSQWGERGLGEYIGLPRQSSWGISTIPNPVSWDNDIVVLSPVRPDGELTTLFAPEGRRLVTEVDLHFDGDRMLFSMPDADRLWQVWEIGADGTGLRQLTPGDQPEVHSYDSCYLPDGRIAFVSTAVLQGVPCNASVVVGMMYRMNADGGGIQQICFEQDHDYYPSVLNDGRVLYLRWDYTDTPHI